MKRTSMGLRRAGLAALGMWSASCAVDVVQAPQGEVPPYDDEPVATVQELTHPSYDALAAEQFDGYGLDAIKRDADAVKGYGTAVVLHIKSTQIDDAESWKVIKELAKGRVVQPWLLLPERDGYFASSNNYVAFIAAAKRLIKRWEAEGLAPTTFVVDMELRHERLMDVLDLQTRGETGMTVDLLATYVNRAEFAAATKAYKDFVDWAHNPALHPKPWKVTVSTLPQLIDDYSWSDSDDDLAQAFNCPIKGIPWDQISFMTFRTMFSGIMGVELGPYFVYDYMRWAKVHFGQNKVGALVGLTDPGITVGQPTYASGTQMLEDIEAAIAAGIPASKIDAYSLRGMLASTKAPISQWFPVARANPSAPAVDAGTVTMHSIYQGLDSLLTVKTIGK